MALLRGHEHGGGPVLVREVEVSPVVGEHDDEVDEPQVCRDQERGPPLRVERVHARSSLADDELLQASEVPALDSRNHPPRHLGAPLRLDRLAPPLVLSPVRELAVSAAVRHAPASLARLELERRRGGLSAGGARARGGGGGAHGVGEGRRAAERRETKSRGSTTERQSKAYG